MEFTVTLRRRHDGITITRPFIALNEAMLRGMLSRVYPGWLVLSVELIDDEEAESEARPVPTRHYPGNDPDHFVNELN